jgi:hypothetical protein
MEPGTLITSVIGVLMPYLIKGGEAIAKSAVDESFQLASKLYKTIKKKFSDDSYAKETLRRIKENPVSEVRKSALAGVLEEKIEADPDFKITLEKLLAITKNSESNTINQNVEVSGNARTGNVTTIGKVNGKVDIGDYKKS